MLLYNQFIYFYLLITTTNNMLSMKSFQIKNMLFYSADELKTSFPNFFIGTSKTVRLIINKKNIPNTDYIYANKIKEKSLSAVCGNSILKSEKINFS